MQIHRILQSHFKKLIIIFVICNFMFSLTGCLAGASPGMKVLRITGEQYYNDAMRYLKTPVFIYDTSKINTTVTNIEKNFSGVKKEYKEKIEDIIVYLKLLKQYSTIFKSGRNSDIKELDKIYKDIIRKTDENSYFLRIFHIYIKSFSRKGLELTDLINLYSFDKYFDVHKDYIFDFSFGGKVIDNSFIKYLINITYLQSGYFAYGYENIDVMQGNKLDEINLISLGELFFRVGMYDESIKYLKYFRLPTYSESVFKDYALTLLKFMYSELDKTTELDVVKEKIKINLNPRVNKVFKYLSDEEKEMYGLFLKYSTEKKLEKEDLAVLEDMLDLSNGKNRYIIKDFNTVAQYEAARLYNKITNKDMTDVLKKISYNLYDFIEMNPVKEVKTLLYFSEKFVEIIPIESYSNYFIKANSNNLKKIIDKKYNFDFKKNSDKDVSFEIESIKGKEGLDKNIIIIKAEE